MCVAPICSPQFRCLPFFGNFDPQRNHLLPFFESVAFFSLALRLLYVCTSGPCGLLTCRWLVRLRVQTGLAYLCFYASLDFFTRVKLINFFCQGKRHEAKRFRPERFHFLARGKQFPAGNFPVRLGAHNIKSETSTFGPGPKASSMKL